MTDYPPPFDELGDAGQRGLPQQAGLPELSGGFPRPGYGPPHRPSDDPVDEPELAAVTDLVRSVLHEHRMRPAARDQLRAQLITAAAAQIHAETPAPTRVQAHSAVPVTPATQVTPAATAPEPEPDGEPGDTFKGAHRFPPITRPSARSFNRSGRKGRANRPAPTTTSSARRRPQRRVPVLGWSAMGAAAALAAVLVVLRGGAGLQTPLPIQSVVATPGIVDRVSADPGEGLTIAFSQAMDRASVTAALRLIPATMVTTSWQGSTMTVSPVHGFAPNSAYVLTIDHTVARTAEGGSPASDVKLTFGTAPVAQIVADAGNPVRLSRTVLTAAETGSEAVVTRDGSVLVTGAQQASDQNGPSGLVRMMSGTVRQLGAATPAICLSRSGRSIAFLTGQGTDTKIAFADGTGTTHEQVPATVDPGTPLGWIGDDEVTFVSGGKLRAVNRAGQLRTVLDTQVSADDVTVLAPGGRFVYLAHKKDTGFVIDLATGHKHQLSGAIGVPTFSADGSTVYWVESHHKRLDLNTAPSGDGPTMSVRLPDITSGDKVSNLSVSPDGSLLAYSVTHTDHSGELRLASLPTLVTLAVSDDGAGKSPNWSPDARMFTVLSSGKSGARIQTVEVPENTTDETSVVTTVAQAFANAQINGDDDAQHAIAPDATLPHLQQRVTRAAVIQVRLTGNGTAIATVRLSVDPTSKDPVDRQATETLQLDVPAGNSIPKVSSVTLTRFAPAPAGPQLSRVDTRSVPGAVLLTFESDLNPLTVPGAVAMLSSGSSGMAVTATYDAETRTIHVQPAIPVSPGSERVTVMVTTALRDVAGNPMATQLALPVQLGTTSQ